MARGRDIRRREAERAARAARAGQDVPAGTGEQPDEAEPTGAELQDAAAALYAVSEAAKAAGDPARPEPAPEPEAQLEAQLDALAQRIRDLEAAVERARAEQSRILARLSEGGRGVPLSAHAEHARGISRMLADQRDTQSPARVPVRRRTRFQHLQATKQD